MERMRLREKLVWIVGALVLLLLAWQISKAEPAAPGNFIVGEQPPGTGEWYEGWPAGWPDIPQSLKDWENLPNCTGGGIPGSWNGQRTALNLNLSNCKLVNVHSLRWRWRATLSNVAIVDSSITDVDRGPLQGNWQNVLFLRTEVAFAWNDNSEAHGFNPSCGSRNVFIAYSSSHDVDGDAFQTGHQCNSNRPSGMYIWRGEFYDIRENALDYKYADNIYAAENRMHGFRSASSGGTWCMPNRPSQCTPSNSGSDGSAVVIGSDGAPRNTYHQNNEIFNAVNGIRVEEALGDIVVSGNNIHDLVGSDTRCLQMDKQGMNIDFSRNRCVGMRHGPVADWREPFSIRIVENYFDRISGNCVLLDDNDHTTGSTLVGNDFPAGCRIQWGNQTVTAPGNSLPGASGNTTH